MEPLWVAFVGIVAGAALAVAVVANRRRARSHAPVDVAGLGFAGGLVVFTSTDCDDCKALITRLRGCVVSVREVTFELEPASFEEFGVSGVPLTVGIDAQRRRVGQIEGMPRPGALERLVAKTKG